jgi:prepilin-type N-terminal cleavage/methylation domain-containing protein
MIGGRQKGFTLIELLVVIAIIGILSAVVLAALSTARTKGNDAAIKSDLETIRTQAGVFYDSHSNDYNAIGAAGNVSINCGTTAGQTANTMLADPNIAAALSAAYTANGKQAFKCVINKAGNSYAIAVPLASGGVWCTDSTSSAQGTNAQGTAYDEVATGGSGSYPAITIPPTTFACN